jgi:lincosamide nucleotidyltransferase A/C/D/E
VRTTNPDPETTLRDVVRFLDLMDDVGVRVWLDGGWGVDACLGEQTRRHGDLDIVVEERDVATVVGALRGRGFVEVPRDDTRAWNFVLGDDAGHQVDFHVIALDDRGDGIQGPPENGERFPAEALSGVGSIGGRAVACITPEWLVRFHSGYPLKDEDRADVRALCERFGLPMPEDHARSGAEP